MKAFATALLNMASFIELSGDETIDPDSAVAALEQLACDLHDATPGEIEYLKAAIREQVGHLSSEARTPDDQRKVDFLLNFLENLGIDRA